MRQLDLKLIQLNYNLHTLEFHISRLEVTGVSLCLSCKFTATIHVTRGNNSTKLDAFYKYMTTLSAITLCPMIISPSNPRELLAEVERDLIGYPKLGLSTSYDGKNICTYYKLLRIISIAYPDALFTIIPVPLIDKLQ